MNRANVSLQDQSAGLLRSGQGVLQRKCACGNKTIAGGECAECSKKKNSLQRKLSIGASNDPLELEADLVADQVMAMSGNSSIGSAPPRIQRFLRQSTGQTDTAPTSVDRVLASSGRPMEPVLRQDMEQRFGHDFSQVRVHSGAAAEQSARDVNAHAYTAGHNVVFGAGQLSPGTNEGRRLIAHELTHVVQQSGAEGMHTSQSSGKRGLSSVIQRFVICEPSESCPKRISGEGGRARRDPMIVRRMSGGLLVGNFNIGRSAIKSDLASNAIWTDFVRAMAANTNEHWGVLGFTDCHGSEALNSGLRGERANSLNSILPLASRNQVDSTGAAPTNDCMAGNVDEEGRALNRSIFIELKYTDITFTDEEQIFASLCGPNVSDWLIGQMNTNQNHPVIRTAREHRWARWVPVFNVGWTVGALSDFYDLVAPGKPWDFKRTMRPRWRVGNGSACPTSNCDRTVTLCGHCVNYDVPGNIHYGWVGRRMELAPWILHRGAGSVQEGNSSGDDPPDTVAINIGIAMADEGKSLCDEVDAKLSQLNLDRTEDCSSCV